MEEVRKVKARNKGLGVNGIYQAFEATAMDRISLSEVLQEKWAWKLET